MRNYELVFVVKPNADEVAREAILNIVKEAVATEGEVVKVDVWGTKKLAYPIAKFTEGHYVLVNFNAGVDVPKELDRNLKINENVIRHMIVVA